MQQQGSSSLGGDNAAEVLVSMREETQKREDEFLTASQTIRGLDEEIAKAEEKLKALDVDRPEVVARLKELANREWDHPVYKNWSVGDPGWEVALTTDVAILQQHISKLLSKLGQVKAATTSSKVISVTKGDQTFDVVVEPNITVQNILQQACRYWDLDPTNYVLQDSDGAIWPLFVQAQDINTDKMTVTTVKKSDADDLSHQVIMENPDEDDEADEDDNDNKDVSTKRLYEDDVPNSIPPGIVVIKRAPVITANSCKHISMLGSILLAAIFTAFQMDFRNIPASFEIHQSMTTLFVNQEYLPPNSLSALDLKTFNQVSTQDDMWDWINVVFKPQMTTPQGSLPWLVPNRLMTTSLAQIAQLRVNNGSCSQAPQLQDVASKSTGCYAQYAGYAASNKFTVGPEQNLQPQFWPAMTGDSIPGAFAYYPAKSLGYNSLTLSARSSVFAAQIGNLSRSSWLDDATRLVVISFSAYAPGSRAFVDVMALFEFTANGGVHPKWIAIPIIANDDEVSFEIAYSVVICVFVVFDWALMYYRGQSLISVASVLNMLLFTFIILYAVGNSQVKSSFSTWQTSLSNTTYSDLNIIAIQYQLVGNYIGIIIVLLAGWILKFLDASPSATLIQRVMARGIHQFLSILAMLGIVATSLAFCAYFSLNAVTTVQGAFSALTFSNGSLLYGTYGWGAIVLSVAALISLYFWFLGLAIASVSFYFLGVSDETRAWGYHWLDAKGSKKYAEMIQKQGRLQDESEVVDARQRLVIR